MKTTNEWITEIGEKVEQKKAARKRQMRIARNMMLGVLGICCLAGIVWLVPRLSSSPGTPQPVKWEGSYQTYILSTGEGGLSVETTSFWSDRDLTKELSTAPAPWQTVTVLGRQYTGSYQKAIAEEAGADRLLLYADPSAGIEFSIRESDQTVQQFRDIHRLSEEELVLPEKTEAECLEIVSQLLEEQKLSVDEFERSVKKHSGVYDRDCYQVQYKRRLAGYDTAEWINVILYDSGAVASFRTGAIGTTDRMTVEGFSEGLAEEAIAKTIRSICGEKARYGICENPCLLLLPDGRTGIRYVLDLEIPSFTSEPNGSQSVLSDTMEMLVAPAAK